MSSGGMNLKKIILYLFIFILLLTNSTLTANASTNTAYIDKQTDRTMVPIRFITHEMGADVEWDKETKTVVITDHESKITLTIGSKQVKVNKNIRLIDQPAVIKEGNTYVPIRFISQTLNAKTEWVPERHMVVVSLNDKSINLPIARESKITVNEQKFKIGSKSLAATVMKIDITNPKYKLQVGLAQDKVGKVESLSGIAKRNKALVAINGTFFDAYTDIKEPYGMVIVDGKLAHIGREKTVFSFDKNNDVFFDILNPSIYGNVGDATRSLKWYAVWMNRTPSKNGSSSILFTPDRGERIGFDYGTNIIVENGVVSDIKTGNVTIPKNGYVLNLTGTLEDNFLPRFMIGEQVNYRVELKNQSYGIEKIEGAIGAGPRLITDGKITVTSVAEGFNDPKILTGGGARSAIGITEDHQLILLTTKNSTINELAEMMKLLGAFQAMNLDGGASSGLYYNGKYITQPGRELSNAILIIE